MRPPYRERRESWDTSGFKKEWQEREREREREYGVIVHSRVWLVAAVCLFAVSVSHSLGIARPLAAGLAPRGSELPDERFARLAPHLPCGHQGLSRARRRAGARVPGRRQEVIRSASAGV